MAYSAASSDKTAIRNDTGSLFGGLDSRDEIDDIQIVSIVGGNAVFTDVAGRYRVTYKAVSQDYEGAGDYGIAVRDAFSSEFNPTSDSSSNDYMLNWANSRFNSVSLEYKSGDNWYLSYKVAMNGGLDEAFPNRSTSDGGILDAIKASTAVDLNVSPTYANTYYKNWEFQCALYNWSYLEGGSFVMYLFGNDNLNGTRLNDVLIGGAGNDNINGGAGNDVLYGSFGADTIYGKEGSDTIVFDGGSSVWNYKANNSFGQRGKYDNYTIDIASGGTGVDYFCFDLPSFTYASGDQYVALPDITGVNTLTTSDNHYNPFLSQSQNSAPFSPGNAKAYGVSPLTFRTRILDFKIGEDKIDLTNLGIDFDFINNRALNKLSGTAFIKAVNTALLPDGLSLVIGKSSSTSNHTTLFVVEVADTNFNGAKNDTLVEIQLVGLSSSAFSIKMFGDAPSI